jgi:phage FluMu protein Com
MTDLPAIDLPGDLAPADIPKVRQCLKCDAKFSSQWSGERICPRCKSTNAWRNGAPMRSHPSALGR